MGVPGAGREAALHATREEYSNKATEFLGSFLQEKPSALDDINWDIPKRRKTSLSRLAADLEEALGRREWFVTGNIEPAFFSEDFVFEDPDVKLAGVRAYARGVNKLFDQSTSRCEVVSAVVNSTQPDLLTITWRLSGGVNIGRLAIKPYIVYTDFKIDPAGLVVSQLDRFSIPGTDILLSALFPFLVGPLKLAPPALPVQELRNLARPKRVKRESFRLPWQ
eukprot:CAMPEP_0173181490 /NCGR_PEP_ID=MMETSP1141-20130122/7309_1 /TAXON_ID=483371 /ORGANISM="non described non described, Strain CCMP2298" /LENGTH=221 /DNA_ID=CAMNT_0014104475 /DNA_START=228 /DNA_END=893 /DNA_ORIENTATION=+